MRLPMDRRGFLVRGAQAAAAGLAAREQLFASMLHGDRQPALRALARPSADQIAWQNLEMGMFVHFAPNTWQDVESDNLSTPLAAINPQPLDTDQWARTALNLGAKYIVFVAKHQGGFCMWQTQTTEYSIGNTPWRNGHGDVLADVAASCRRYGLKLGAYVCPRDDHFGAKTGGVCSTPAQQARYDAMYREQLTEVWSRYGEMVEIWFDGSTVTPVADLIRKYQPHAMVFQGPQATIRWVGNENGFAPYPCWNGIDAADASSGVATALNSDPNGSVWMPNEVDVSIRRPDWFWSTKNAGKVLTVDQMLSIYYRSVGRGAQLLLNIPVNRDGLLAEKDCAHAAAFGAEITRRFANPLAQTAGRGLILTLKLESPARIDTIVLQEEISLGERVRAYRLEGRVDGRWRTLGNGSAIGHKRIQPVIPVTVSAVRMIVTEAAAEPAIRRLAAFDTQSAPPEDWNQPSDLWAANRVGSWSANRFSLDLTSQTAVAAQYLLRFLPDSGSLRGLRDVVLTLRGVAEPSFVRRVAGHPDELQLDITGVDEMVHLSGVADGAASGKILLRRL